MAKRTAPQPVPDLLEGYDPSNPASLDEVEQKVREYTKVGGVYVYNQDIGFHGE